MISDDTISDIKSERERRIAKLKTPFKEGMWFHNEKHRMCLVKVTFYPKVRWTIEDENYDSDMRLKGTSNERELTLEEWEMLGPLKI